MSLSPGTRLGPYEILSPLGAGGMGEVYRARDTRLGRDVAVKVLPPHLSPSPEARLRFELEAKTISQLSHPHICALHDVGRQGETEYLVMELLEGETLAERLARGRLPPEQALRYGQEIADALDKAHRQGIVHRDLKPGNVMITRSGVKLLDFGLAKAMPPTPKTALTSLPTQQGLTQEGSILGTFQYMAPEQLEGKEADARTDIFAFGSVLYEMATGAKAFTGGSQASLISSIMTRDPTPIADMEPMSPPALDRVVQTCLAKDPEDRWQSAADIKRELKWIAEGGQPAAPAAQARSRRTWLPWAIAGASVLLASGTMLRNRGRLTPAAPRLELAIALPERTVLSDFFAVSPDGRTLAFAGTADDKSLLRLRNLASSDVRALPGTDSPETIFWSPDGQSLAFVSRGKLRRIDVATGSIEVLAEAQSGRGGTWGIGGDILFAQKAAGAIFRVAASGGPATAATSLEKGDLMHRWPQFLPDGKHFLFFVKTGDPDTTGTYFASLGTPGRKLVLRNGAAGVFAAPDRLLYGRNSALLAQPFDPGTGQLGGSPQTVTRPLMRAELGSYTDDITVSNTGVLILRAASADRQLTWLDRHGNVLSRLGQSGVIMSVNLSPDEREAAIAVRTLETGNYTSSIVDLVRDVSTPLPESAAMPVWNPDGRTLIYRSEGANYTIRRRAAHGDPKDEAIGVVAPFATPHSLSPDGRFLLYTQMGGNFDVGLKDLRGGEAVLILKSEFDERTPHFSPDGRWFVYSSDEPGQTEIFVRRFPVTEETWRVSTSGGQQPAWSRDGKEIFFVSLDGRVMAAPVTTAGSTFSSGPPQTLFRAPVWLGRVANQYDVSGDGQRFLMALAIQDPATESFRVLLELAHAVTLAAGTRLGPYEILSPLGAGGMGEVYRARDTRLGREVAVKILPAGLTGSEQARQRFEREARTISQLSHPHICALYDVGREGETEYLVMELLDGQTLSDRLAKGPLPLDQALRFGREVADALDKAHRGGIIHRDLKPGNVMLTSSGVKVLDFGLAKALGPADAVASLTALPTETPLTEAGMVLGTVQYMAPEQLEGKDADARTDIFALGLLLYEMTTGRRAFSGATRASLIGSILRDDPSPISHSEPLSPRALDRVVATCLAKEPEERWQTARDVALQLEGIRQERSASGVAVAAPGPRLSRFLPWAVATAAVVLAAWGLTRGGARTAPSPIRTVLLPPPANGFNYGANSAPAVIAPDQTRLVFGTRDADGATRLWIQELDATEPYPVPGTDGALFPFWSPDGKSLGFFARGTLKVIEASRSPGQARTLAANILEARGGTWGEDGTILYSPGNVAVIWRVPAAGGKPEIATHLDGDEKSHRWPRFLPGSRRFLYEVRQPGPGSGAAALASRLTYLASLDGKKKRLVLSDVTSAVYVPPGHLLFGRANNVMAVACDPKTLELKGEPVVLASNVQGFAAPGAPFFTASERLLVYSQNAGTRTTRMVWFDRSGNEVGMVGGAGDYLTMGMAPDGRTVVASRAEEPLPPDLWLFDTGAGRGIRLTRDNVPQLAPVVAPGGQRFFFSSFSRGPWDIWSTTARGGTDLKPFLESDTPKAAKDVSPDGRFLLYREFNVGTLGDLKVASLEGDPAPRTFIGTADDENNGDFSPDGRWVAYVSDESGRQEVYVASFPDPVRRLRVTSEGGSQPRWSRDGKELFCIRAGQLVAIPVTGTGEDLAFGQGRALFAIPLFFYGDTGFDVATRYDVAPDGRFLALVKVRDEKPESLAFVQNWASVLKTKP